MPTYDYECNSCGTFEEYQSITAAPLECCPRCGDKVRRLISRNPVILFKGPGFHVNDYRKTSAGDSSKEDSGSSKKEDGQAAS